MDPAVVLEASVRVEVGKKISRQLRRSGEIPAIVYGEGKTPTVIATSEKDVSRLLHTSAGGNVLITLKLKDAAGKKHADKTVLIKEIQHHPITTKVLHIDFNEVSLTKRIVVKVPLHFTGEAIGVKQDGGRLDHLLWEVEVECLPTEIPKRIDVDVSHLKIGDSLSAGDLKVSQGVRLMHDAQMPVAACLPPIVEKAPEAAAEAAATEPEVIKQKKPETEEAAAGAAKPAEKAQKSEKDEKKE